MKRCLLTSGNARAYEDIKKVEIGPINFLKDTCRIIIYYEDKERSVNLADLNGNIKTEDDDDE